MANKRTESTRFAAIIEFINGVTFLVAPLFLSCEAVQIWDLS